MFLSNAKEFIMNLFLDTNETHDSYNYEEKKTLIQFLLCTEIYRTIDTKTKEVYQQRDGKEPFFVTD